MEFLTLLIVLGILQVWGSGGPLHHDQWFYRFAKTVKPLLPLVILRLVVIVIVPLVLLWFLLALLESRLYGLLSLLLYVGILLYSLGRSNISESLRRYLSAWNHSNFESAYEQAIAIGDFQESEAITDHVSLHEHVRTAFLYEGFERWFAVVFWFLLLGPLGALAYRLCYLSGRIESLGLEDRQIALRFVHYLDWIPVRLLVLSFALTGNFVNGFNRLWQKFYDNQPAPELLDSCALSAISASHEQQAYPADQAEFIAYGCKELLSLQSLLSRSVICWLIIIAVITLAAG
jgi:AmpE protein